MPGTVEDDGDPGQLKATRIGLIRPDNATNNERIPFNNGAMYRSAVPGQRQKDSRISGSKLFDEGDRVQWSGVNGKGFAKNLKPE